MEFSLWPKCLLEKQKGQMPFEMSEQLGTMHTMWNYQKVLKEVTTCQKWETWSNQRGGSNR